MNNDLILNLDKLHTTELGVMRIKRNLSLDTDDVVVWCKKQIANPNSHIERKGKNFYIAISGAVITVNAHSYTIITAHKVKSEDYRMSEKKEVIVPIELSEIMATDIESKDFFESLTDGYKRGYCDWVGGAKAEATRKTRAEKALAMLQRKQKTLKT